MADEPQISILDARLAEIDRRLRTIQTGLAGDAGTASGSGAGLAPKIAVPEPEGRSGLARRPVALAPPVPGETRDEEELADEDPGLIIAELRGLISDHARLLDAMGVVLASGERLLARVDALAPAPVPADTGSPSQGTAGAGSPSQLTVVAGPFASLHSVRDFERSLETLPNVASVQARGYEGGDRAVVDVRLARPNP